ncbi:FAD-dependent monooxygenase [Nocardia donostiensis]|uniref:Monooxygenase n=1 Tax=Nocardia donostiensis TaxID=1538463 RepID=A0A1W0B9K4_9NOCA|nr:FAD-dependent monooxygenase [Nocardia donostiensis]ONM49602.1 monooxygenase [Nocardia donostiensis]OQS19223.1 monooxygenase [Nocardia donostiensis]
MGRQAVVIGGGIGGLAAALALYRRGWGVEVLERAPEFAEVGAGLALQPNALSALEHLGLGDAVRDRGLTDPPVGIRTASGRWLIRNDLPELRRRYGQWIMLPRTELLDLLRAALPSEVLRPSIEVTEVSADGTVVHSGGISQADLVVGADGLRSVTRRSLWPDEPGPRYAGFGTWRLIVAPRAVDGSVETWGRRARFGYAPLPDGRVYCYIMVDAAQGDRGSLAELRRSLTDWHAPIPALLADADETTALYHDTFELPELRTYVSGRVALLGDAAHAMTPNLGQGAGQALEDAVVLAGAVEDATVPAGLEVYDRVRRPRTQMVVRRSRRIGAMARGFTPLFAPVRDAAMNLAPRSVMARSLAPIVGWTADSIAGPRKEAS